MSTTSTASLRAADYWTPRVDLLLAGDAPDSSTLDRCSVYDAADEMDRCPWADAVTITFTGPPADARRVLDRLARPDNDTPPVSLADPGASQ